MRNDIKVAVLLCTAVCAGMAQASTADELAKIEAEHVLLKARLRVLETRAQMAARQAEIERYAPLQRHAAPSVDSIEGVDGRLQATLLMENGRQAEVVAGDVLPNGMRVVSVQPDGVVVSRPDHKRMRLKPSAQPREQEAAIPATLEAPARAQRPPAVPPPPVMAPMPQPGAMR